MSENPWFLINRGTQAKGWRGSGKWNQEKDTISHFCGPLSYFRICCNESLRHSTDTFKWWRKFIVRWRACDKNLSSSPPSLSEAYDQKRKSRHTTGVLFSSLVKSANEPSMEEFFFFVLPPHLPKMYIGEGWLEQSFEWRESCLWKGMQNQVKRGETEERVPLCILGKWMLPWNLH